MKWCQPHWDELRAEVRRQGLSALVPDSGEKAAAAFSRSAEGEQSVDSFDPLMGAMMDVNEFLSMAAGNRLWAWFVDGCPVCEADKGHMAACGDDRHPKPCTTSFAWCFVNAVHDQRAEFERRSS